jgi:hypothetical protein
MLFLPEGKQQINLQTQATRHLLMASLFTISSYQRSCNWIPSGPCMSERNDLKLVLTSQAKYGEPADFLKRAPDNGHYCRLSDHAPVLAEMSIVG